ncbi:MAG: ATP-dependent helicase, partial [bacterium]
VDEYQDTNVIQAEIVELLAGEHRNLMVVGDDAQSIYGWRGANFENILHFPQRMGGEVYRLEENYRSTPNILDLANESINHNEAQFPKNLRAVKPESVHPQITHTYDWREEAELIVERILDYHDQDISFREMGVLYRNHSQSAELQLRLTEQGIPFIVRSGVKFFEQAHIKDIVAFLKVVHNPLDELAWLRILKMLPGIGNTTAQKIYRVFAVQRAVRLTADNLDLTQAVPAKAREEWKKLLTAFHEILGDQITPSMMIERVYEAFYRDVLFNAHDNPWEREADLKFLAEFGAKYRSLDNFLAQLALVGATVIRDHEEEQAGERDTLTLTTIHQAKGLEWEVVFVIGVVEGQFPHRDCLTPQSRLEEERRLFYVSVTRSKQHLQITVPLISYRYGNYEVCSASRFVEELPGHVADIAKVGEVERLEAGFRAAPSFSIEF